MDYPILVVSFETGTCRNKSGLWDNSTGRYGMEQTLHDIVSSNDRAVFFFKLSISCHIAVTNI